MKIIKVFQVHGDGGERSIGPVIGYASTKSRADEKAKGQAWYGGDGWISEMAAIELDTGEIYILASPIPADIDGVRAKADAILREQTLALLSTEQRRVLGIKD